MEKSQSTEIDNNIYKENPTPAEYIYNLSIIIKWVGITPSLTDNLSKKKTNFETARINLFIPVLQHQWRIYDELDLDFTPMDNGTQIILPSLRSHCERYILACGKQLFREYSYGTIRVSWKIVCSKKMWLTLNCQLVYT